MALTSSAGNTRGLIEAPRQPPATATSYRLPRGIPAASLKRELELANPVTQRVFRGEYPRPH